MANSISWAQEVITCDLCDNATQVFCNKCQVSLWEECINKHVRNHKSLSHDIVPFKNRTIQLVFPECEFHDNQRCEAYCQRCGVPVCMKCVITSHNGHKMREIPKNINDKKKEIQKETFEIESSIIPMYWKKSQEAEKYKTSSIEKFSELGEETEKHRQDWRQEIDNIFDNLSFLIKRKKENHLALLETHQSKIRNMIPVMMETAEQNKELLKSNKVYKVTNYKSKIEKYRNIPAAMDQTLPSLKTDAVQGRELSIELGEYKVTLTQTSLSSLLFIYKIVIRRSKSYCHHSYWSKTSIQCGM
ncbi:E3 ubiquitin-protein ligase TRIM45-like [Saccostrea echinata]|uniref:E3 ubiquitin-protein ligase TRIM45-like n=1 Tax=Saccostrea echinata TaxID=191078 RepID=UPI002A7F8BD0|nr:E3 ubiquitin-protein ligase TRIM45-like [Saccostrea echinata]